MDMHRLRRIVTAWWGVNHDGLQHPDSEYMPSMWEQTETFPSDQPEHLSLDVLWLKPSEIRRVLRFVAESWHIASTDYTELAEIQWEVWNASQGLQPQPDIAIAWMKSERPTYPAFPLGVLSGRPNFAAKYYYISNLALHPRLQAGSANRATLWRNAAGRRVAETLIHAAIDISHELGNYGWVAATPAPGDERGWNALKFYSHDAFTYRRMGYFTS
ncbi:hypothetical protein [Alicyclobacillus sp. ALC3]|uniref:hypothetical protein n=1 Tax=Alicyclobacillus sp. ALC3 TaxID=2796143 RepID=UPI0023781B74|nr:hypothetical protein [Alicyclobacillus sp. ALC3]WDL96253.1 hypothetical protein JC200_18235 [Alicyclobacillus sp. ALC3]